MKSDIQFELSMLKHILKELEHQNEAHPGTLHPEWIRAQARQALHYIKEIEKELKTS